MSFEIFNNGQSVFVHADYLQNCRRKRVGISFDEIEMKTRFKNLKIKNYDTRKSKQPHQQIH